MYLMDIKFHASRVSLSLKTPLLCFALNNIELFNIPSKSHSSLPHRIKLSHGFENQKAITST